MEALPPLVPNISEMIIIAIQWAIAVGVGIASFRRCRHLSRYPIWRSLLTAALAGLFWILWLIAWWVNRDRTAQEWHDHRQIRASAPA